MLKLSPKEKCPFSFKCPYTDTVGSFCRGADSNRDTPFTCEFVSEQGTFIENKFRSKFDSTGKMKVLQE